MIGIVPVEEDPGMSEGKPLRLAFVCVENACRSQMAEGFARFHGGSSVRAESAGSRPAAAVNPKAVASMKDRGIDLARHRPKGAGELRGSYDAIVTMGCGDACPSADAKRRIEWSIPDPKEMPPAEFAAVRDTIEAKVKQLLEDLK
jgi:protein-tyrosine-phosphatase